MMQELARYAALGALCLGLGLAGCQKKEPAPEVAVKENAPLDAEKPPEPAPAVDPFARAAIYACPDGAEIAVLFLGGDAPSVKVRAGAAEPMTLAADLGASEQVFADAAHTLTLRGDEALFATGSAAPMACEAVSRSLPPPPVGGAMRDVRAEDEGATIALKVGDTFSISLSGVPTAGYVWALEEAPACVEKTGETGGPTSTAQYLPGYAGGSHWEVTAFRATAPGEGTLTMAQRRPWEDSSEPAVETFSVTVSVQ